MLLRETTKFKTKDGKPKKFYGCSTYPKCQAVHGAHPDGRPLGIPGNKEVKELRMIAHRNCETIWGEWKTMDKERKEAMYAWLKKNTKSGHIAKMGKEELEDLLIKLREI